MNKKKADRNSFSVGLYEEWEIPSIVGNITSHLNDKNNLGSLRKLFYCE